MGETCMRRTIPLVTLALALRLLAGSSAAVIVNPAQPITRQVRVQMIQTALDNGSSPAPLFGDATRDAAIKSAVDTIWSQAGVDVQFLPGVVRYNNTFANQGLLGVGVRPLGDLEQIVAGAQAHGGILNSDPTVLNMFFVNVVPGFNLKAENWVTGSGHVGANGIAVFVGASTSAEHAGHWVAHEIGHNLGLSHASAGDTNLMASNRNTELLTQPQIAAALQSSFARPISISTGPVAGDYDRNGRVDASDYAIWRNTLNSRSNLAADGNGNGIVDQGDLSIWKMNYGRAFAAHTVLAGDFNLDGTVDSADYVVWRGARGSTANLAADANNDGVVDDSDYGIWQRNFGMPYTPIGGTESGGDAIGLGTGNPEPSASILFMMGGSLVALLRRR
jgi:hypothetical protein